MSWLAPFAGTRGGSLHGVAAPLETGGVRAIVVGLLLASLRLLLGNRRLILPVLLVAAHRPEDRAGRSPCRRALSGIAADRAANGADRGAPGCPANRAAARRRRRRWGLGGSRVVPALLQRPPVTLGLVLLLLLLALTLLGVRIDLLAARRARRKDTGEHGDGHHDVKARSQSLHDYGSLVTGPRSRRWPPRSGPRLRPAGSAGGPTPSRSPRPGTWARSPWW